MVKISIIVLCYNGRKYLGKCLNSLNNLNYNKKDYEILVADNNSEDGSVSFVKKNYPYARILKLDRNYGFAEGNNKGAKEAKGEYLVFLNQDTKVERNWLKELMRFADKNSIIGAKEINKEKNYGGYLTYTGLGTKEQKKSEGYVYGSSLLVSKELFNKLEGFDKDYFMYGEDVDLCWRAQIYGNKIKLAEKAEYWHYEKSFLKVRESFLFYITKNSLSNIIKNFDDYLVYAFFVSFIYNSFQFFKYLLVKPKNSSKIILAYCSFIIDFAKILKKRRLIKKNRKIPDKELKKNKKILSLMKSIKKEKMLIKREGRKK